MNGVCTIAAVIQLLGYMPPPGTVISVPAAEVAKYPKAQIAAAKLCARYYKIRYRIVN